MRLSRFLPRFSLRSLLLLSLLAASGFGLWWKWEPWELEQALPGGHRDRSLGPTISNNGTRIILGSEDGLVRIWDVEHNKLKANLTLSSDIEFAEFSSDARLLFTRHSDSTGRIWNAENGTQLVTLNGKIEQGHVAVFSPDNKVLARATGKTIEFWDTAGGVQRLHKEVQYGDVNCLEYSPDGRFIAVANNIDTVRVWNLESGEQRDLNLANRQDVWSINFSPDGRRVLTAHIDCAARIWETSTGKHLLTLGGHTSVVADARFSPDGRKVVTAGLDGTARIWDASSGSQLWLLDHGYDVRTSRFSHDGSRILSTSVSETRVWSVETGDAIAKLNGESMGALFTADGARIVTSSQTRSGGSGDDYIARIWRRRRPEWWWGVAWLPEFWLTVLFAGALVWSLLRDRRELRKKMDATQTANSAEGAPSSQPGLQAQGNCPLGNSEG